MNTEKKVLAFTKLGDKLRGFASPSHSPAPSGAGGGGRGSSLQKAIKKSSQQNGWFTEENILFAIRSIGEMSREEKIRKWISNYNIPPAPLQRGRKKRIGVIMAGNIPLVGFHDFLCVLFSGNIFVGKLSSEDKYLLPAVSEILIEIEPEFKDRVHFIIQPFNHSTTQQLISAFIATGSNNSARYFEYYFRSIPHLIRKNRNSVAILDGTETEEDLRNLGKDIFQYFGLGCRNVSKVFIPQNYDLNIFFSAIVGFGKIIHHNKYFNNYNYYRSIYLLNKEKILDNGFLLLKEDERIASPVATLYYERYKNKEEVFRKLKKEKENIQCVVTSPLLPSPVGEGVGVRLGQTQSPELWDYADGMDTMEFLFSLRNANQYECY